MRLGIDPSPESQSDPTSGAFGNGSDPGRRTGYNTLAIMQERRSVLLRVTYDDVCCSIFGRWMSGNLSRSSVQFAELKLSLRGKESTISFTSKNGSVRAIGEN